MLSVLAALGCCYEFEERTAVIFGGDIIDVVDGNRTISIYGAFFPRGGILNTTTPIPIDTYPRIQFPEQCDHVVILLNWASAWRLPRVPDRDHPGTELGIWVLVPGPTNLDFLFTSDETNVMTLESVDGNWSDSHEVEPDERVAVNTNALLLWTILEVVPAILGSSILFPRNPATPKLELFAQINDTVQYFEFIPEPTDTATPAVTSRSEPPPESPTPDRDTSTVDRILVFVGIGIGVALAIGGFALGCYSRYMRIKGGRGERREQLASHEGELSVPEPLQPPLPAGLTDDLVPTKQPAPDP